MDLPESADVLAQPTRARLFKRLQELRRAATTEELASGLELHVNGVRRHLERLQGAGLLERSRASHGPGRPRDEWAIAANANPGGERPEAYADLARWLVRSIATEGEQLARVERTGREIGRELAPEPSPDLAESLRQVFSSLGFQPEIEADADSVRCSLCNCPYRDSARENQELICTLHKGLTEGLLDGLDPSASLARFEPRDPDQAGCVVEVAYGAAAGRDS